MVHAITLVAIVSAYLVFQVKSAVNASATWIVLIQMVCLKESVMRDGVSVFATRVEQELPVRNVPVLLPLDLSVLVMGYAIVRVENVCANNLMVGATVVQRHVQIDAPTMVIATLKKEAAHVLQDLLARIALQRAVQATAMEMGCVTQRRGGATARQAGVVRTVVLPSALQTATLRASASMGLASVIQGTMGWPVSTNRVQKVAIREGSVTLRQAHALVCLDLWAKTVVQLCARETVMAMVIVMIRLENVAAIRALGEMHVKPGCVLTTARLEVTAISRQECANAIKGFQEWHVRRKLALLPRKVSRAVGMEFAQMMDCVSAIEALSTTIVHIIFVQSDAQAEVNVMSKQESARVKHLFRAWTVEPLHVLFPTARHVVGMENVMESGGCVSATMAFQEKTARKSCVQMTAQDMVIAHSLMGSASVMPLILVKTVQRLSARVQMRV